VTGVSVTLPAHQLIGFARVDLEPCAPKSVSFAVPMSVLAYTGTDRRTHDGAGSG